MPKEITDTFNKVKHLLEIYPKYRDSDEELVVRFWWDELRAMKLDGRKITAFDFLTFYRECRLTKADIITRARRKICETYPDLIGKSYKPRMEKEGKMKEDLRKIGKKKK